MWVFIQKKPEAVQSEFFNMTGGLFWMSFLCGVWIKDQPGRQGARAASFPSWGLAKRHVRVRKELSLGVGNSTRNSHLAQPGRARNLLKPVSSSEAFTFPCRPHAHLHQSQHNAFAGSSRFSKQADIFLSISPNLTCSTWLRTHIQNKAPQMASTLTVCPIFNTKSTSTAWISSCFTEVSTPQVLLLLGGQSHFLNFSCYNLGETHNTEHHTCFLNEWKRE